MDIKRALREAISTGEVCIGYKSTVKHLERKREIKLAIVSKNCPREYVEALQKKKVKIYVYDGTNLELGATCGKPFAISVLGISDPGESEILLLKEEKR
ncbi:MAG: 50S ribosomal protein L30e [Thermoplasmata archaeon]|nr:50S ribosomal protein L30e [Thermoplasmata archaeon]